MQVEISPSKLPFLLDSTKSLLVNILPVDNKAYSVYEQYEASLRIKFLSPHTDACSCERAYVRARVRTCVRVCFTARSSALSPTRKKTRLHRISRQTKNQFFNFPAHGINYLCPQLLVQVVMIYGKNT